MSNLFSRKKNGNLSNFISYLTRVKGRDWYLSVLLHACKSIFGVRIFVSLLYGHINNASFCPIMTFS